MKIFESILFLGTFLLPMSYGMQSIQHLLKGISGSNPIVQLMPNFIGHQGGIPFLQETANQGNSKELEKHLNKNVNKLKNENRFIRGINHHLYKDVNYLKKYLNPSKCCNQGIYNFINLKFVCDKYVISGCPSGSKEYSGHCFAFVNKKLNFKNAERACMSRGGFLADPETFMRSKSFTSFLKYTLRARKLSKQKKFIC